MDSRGRAFFLSGRASPSRQSGASLVLDTIGAVSEMQPGIALLHQIAEGGDVRIEPVAQSIADLGHEAFALLSGLEKKAGWSSGYWMMGRHRETPFCGLLLFVAASRVPGLP